VINKYGSNLVGRRRTPQEEVKAKSDSDKTGDKVINVVQRIPPTEKIVVIWETPH
jgi:hypothetical protein